MSDTEAIKVKGLVFGAGSFRDEGTLMEFEFDNCSPVIRVRPLNATRIKKLRDKDVDLDSIFPELEEFQIPSFDDEKKLILDDDGEIVKVAALRVKGGMNAWLADNAEAFADICEELVVSFDGIKREDGTLVECNEDTIRGLGNFHEFVVKLLKAARLSNKAISKNLSSLSDGKSLKTPEPGEPILQPVTETE